MTRPAFDWRRAVVYLHRWLGIGGCVLFVVWFGSGIVMMYARMPSLSAEERLARLPPLDLSTARVGPAEAARQAGLSPSSVRLGMLAGRPVYRMQAGRAWGAVFADTGEAIAELTAAEALDVGRRFLPEHAARLREGAYLVESDQWTLSPAVQPLMPLHRLDVGDDAGTTLYVSGLTGDPVLKTTRRERLLGYGGAVLHWLYFTPFRRHLGLWVQTIVWLSLAGTVACLSGLLWGLWRYSPFGRYRLRHEASHSPYAGVMKWHHYAGLLFGLTTTTWIFSGLMSMTPWDWSPGNRPTQAQREAVTGGPLRLEPVTLEALRQGVATLGRSFTPREVEILQFQGEPFLLAYRPPAEAAPSTWTNTDKAAFLDAGGLDRRFVSLRAPERGAFERFGADVVASVARVALPGRTLVAADWLGAYDSYYYSRSGDLPLPVLRARYDDPVGTWLYFDPSRGAVVQKEERRSRLERWLYHGLHSLDFPFLYYRRPLWDILLVGLSVGGLVSAATSVWPAWRRLRGHARRLVGRGASGR